MAKTSPWSPQNMYNYPVIMKSKIKLKSTNKQTNKQTKTQKQSAQSQAWFRKDL
jgi:hypothetical protein